MFFPTMTRAAALVALAALAACGGGGGGGGSNAVPVVGVSDAQVAEGASGTVALAFTVTLEGADSAGVRVFYEVDSTAKEGGGSTGNATGGASCTGAADYLARQPDSIFIPPGAGTGTISVTVCGDAAFEPHETLALRWNTSFDAGTAIGTIVNDDAGGLNGTGVPGSFGRDSNPLTNSNADGRLGFSFAKAPSAASWQCTRDKVTGLLWEGKAAGGGLHDATRTYTWAQLAAFVAAVNAEALCGRTDWRLPTPDELASLVDAGTASAPTIDTDWLPNQQAAPYWSGTTYQGASQDAWLVDFNTGTVAVENKATNSFHARLVTSGGMAAPAPLPASCGDASAFTDHRDGTVTDRRTGLMWKKCAEGFSGASCAGAGLAVDWQGALNRPAAANADAAGAGLGYGDWRLPTRAELSSLAERAQCFDPASNPTAFPGGEPLGFWTATPYAFSNTLAWSVDFYDGQVAPAVKTGLGSSSKRVRLVRAGQ